MAAIAALAMFAATRRVLLAAAGTDDGQDAPTPEASRLAHRVALGAALAFGLGTSVWSTASQAMWAHTPALLGYAVALWALGDRCVGRRRHCCRCCRACETGNRAGGGTPPSVHPACCVAPSPSGGARVRARPAHLAARRRVLRVRGVCRPPGACIQPQNLRKRRRGRIVRTDFWVQRLNAPHMFAGSVIEGLAGLTISPSRGILRLLTDRDPGARGRTSCLEDTSVRVFDGWGARGSVAGSLCEPGGDRRLDCLLEIPGVVGRTRLWPALSDRPDAVCRAAVRLRVDRP